MEVTRVQKKIRVTPLDAVKYQLLTELLFIQKQHLIPSDVDILSLLGLWGPMELRAFCAEAVQSLYRDLRVEDRLTREQNIRNRIGKLISRQLISRQQRQIQLHPSLHIRSGGNLLFEYNLLCLESAQT